MPQSIDLTIAADWIIPVEPDGVVFEHYALAIDNGKVLELVPQKELTERYTASQHFQLDGQALIPGLVNAHTHAAMSLMRGIADDLPLLLWLENHIWPAEQQVVSHRFVADGTRLAVAEMLRSGTTCFADMYFHPDAAAEVAIETGIRSSIGMIMLQFPSSWADKPRDYLHKGLAVFDQFKQQDLVNFHFAPHAPYTVDDDSFASLLTYSNELGVPIHTHLHETAQEITDSMKQFGCRPIERLERLGLLSPLLTAVHMTQVSERDLRLLGRHQVNVVHCPQSNMKLASGFCPIQKLREAKVNVGLGTDGAASNNDLDMLAEMQSAALLAKAVSNSAAALSASKALRMATLGSAKAIGLADTCGSLEPGKAADVVAIDLARLETQPVYNATSQIVYAAGREQVSHVFVDGRVRLRDRELVGLDQDALIANARQWQQTLAKGQS